MTNISFCLNICVLLLGSFFSSTAADHQFKCANATIDQTWKLDIAR